jgi:hypothetical protein
VSVLRSGLYNFDEDRGSALQEIFEVLEEEQRKLAEMIVWGD